MAKAERDLADSTKDLNRMNAAKSNLEAKAAREGRGGFKIDYAKARRSHARSLVDAMEAKISALRSRYEQSKAQLAGGGQGQRKPTADFSVATFDQQASDAQRKADDAKLTADRRQLEATQAQGKYNQLFQKLQMMTGIQMNQGMPGMQPGMQQPMQPGQPGMQPMQRTARNAADAARNAAVITAVLRFFTPATAHDDKARSSQPSSDIPKRSVATGQKLWSRAKGAVAA